MLLGSTALLLTCTRSQLSAPPTPSDEDPSAPEPSRHEPSASGSAEQSPTHLSKEGDANAGGFSLAKATIGPQAFGAKVPFTTWEAEDSALRTSGARLQHLVPPGPNEVNAALEASRRGYVELTRAGDFLEITAQKPGNAVLVRFGVPARDTKRSQRQLRLTINGGLSRTLTLDPQHTLLFAGSIGVVNGQSRQAGNHPHVFWDEARWLLPSSWQTGDTLRFELLSALALRLDLIELEAVSPARAAPEGALSVLECGAVPNDGHLDTLALKKCFARARSEGRVAWIPAGLFLHDERFDLQGLQIQGAGMWHTILRSAAPTPARRFGGAMGFRLSSEGSSVRQLTIEANDRSRADGSIAFVGRGRNWLVQQVWMRWLNVGIWAGGVGGKAVENRVRSTYADGININNGNDHRASDILVRDNHVRGTGDDGIAVLSHLKSPYPAARISVDHNTVISPWWGHNLDVAGGRGHRVSNNLLADSVFSGALTINLPESYPMTTQESLVVSNNLLLRAGGNLSGQQRGAIWLYAGSSAIRDVVLRENTIVAPWFSALDVRGPGAVSLEFRDNEIFSLRGRSVVTHNLGACRFRLEGNRVDADSATEQAKAPELPKQCQIVSRENSW